MAILSALEVGENTAEGSDSDAASEDDALVEIVEALRGCSVWAIDTNFDVCFLAFLSEVSELGSPVSVGFDVDLHFVIYACGNGERMPLKEGELRDLEKDVLAGLVGPVSVIGNSGTDANSFSI